MKLCPSSSSSEFKNVQDLKISSSSFLLSKLVMIRSAPKPRLWPGLRLFPPPLGPGRIPHSFCSCVSLSRHSAVPWYLGHCGHPGFTDPSSLIYMSRIYNIQNREEFPWLQISAGLCAALCLRSQVRRTRMHPQQLERDAFQTEAIESAKFYNARKRARCIASPVTVEPKRLTVHIPERAASARGTSYLRETPPRTQ